MATIIPDQQQPATVTANGTTNGTTNGTSSSPPHHLRVLVLPGDHVGPEVMVEALKTMTVLDEHLSRTKGLKFELTHDILGGASLDKEGTPVTDRVLNKAMEVDAVLFGSVGGPEWGTKWPNPESGLLKLRQHMKAFANLRPCTIYSQSLIPRSPLKPEIVTGVNFITLRENCGGAYYGDKTEQADYAADVWQYSTEEVARCARVAGALARTMGADGRGGGGPATVWSSDKANVLASGRLWRRVTTEIFEAEFPDVPLKHQLADSLSLRMMTSPRMFNGIIHTDNTFGDMLSDQAGGVTGTLGMLPSASLCGVPGDGLKCNGIYEPVHGSAPDISGQQKVNPSAQILSVALMLRYSFGLLEEALAVEKAVRLALDGKDIGGLEVRTPDLGGTHTTAELGDAIALTLKKLLQSQGHKTNGVAA